MNWICSKIFNRKVKHKTIEHKIKKSQLKKYLNNVTKYTNIE